MTVLSEKCRKLLYRMSWQTPDGTVDVFALRSSRGDARDLIFEAVSLISGIHRDELEMYNLRSFRDLVDTGVSEDEDLRIFETAWKGAVVSGWTSRPLFLTEDVTLAGVILISAQISG
ncbi:hypothetical protein [Paraburkholderia sp. J8-2]|uniref:hypothetical protein n=1 Tax=Paraburkholderia sp. J8-2 TaxID=2805440 RepID=UPI002AB6F3E2|nr:hypothetical protein [Paraburkholderia sp. J8-2]